MRRRLLALLLLTTCGDGGPVELCLLGASECAGRCVRLERDPDNCGACGVVCPNGMACAAGGCVPRCGDGFELCDGACVDLEHDAKHCGACDDPCDAAEVCEDGACEPGCAGGALWCGGVCVDAMSDPQHCGDCGFACASGEACLLGNCVACPPGFAECAGGCVDLASADDHCGACDHSCGPGRACVAGACTIWCGDEPCPPCGAKLARQATDSGIPAMSQDARAVAFDAGTGDIVVGIELQNEMTIVGAPAFTASGVDALVLKLAPDGTILWYTQLGGAQQQHIQDVAVGEDGSVVVGGYFTGELSIDGSLPIDAMAGEDGFVVELDADDGSVEWFVTVSSADLPDAFEQRERVGAVALAGGDVLLGGTIGGPGELYLGGAGAPINDDPLVFHDDTSCMVGQGGADTVHCLDGFVARLDPDGGHVWSESFGGDEDDVVRSVAGLSTGETVAAGSFASSISFAGDTFATTGTSSEGAFVVQVTSAGVPAWARGFTGLTDDTVRGVAIAVAPGGELWLLGDFNQDLTVGSQSFTASNDNFDLFLAHLMPDGTVPGGIQIGSAARERAIALAIDDDGRRVVAGTFRGATTLGDDVLVANADNPARDDAFLAVLSAANDPTCARAFSIAGSFPTEGTASPRDVAVFQGAAALAGVFDEAIDPGMPPAFTAPNDGSPKNDGFFGIFGL